MERDVELRLSTQMAAIEATLSGFAKDATRRLDRIETQVTRTNGRVDELERRETARASREEGEREQRDRLPPLNWMTLEKLARLSGWIIAGVLGWVLFQ